MTETLTVTSERVDDLPLLLAHLEHMGVHPLLDEHFPPHGNWQGLSLGRVTMVWLTHILSQADHRLSYVQPWAEKRLETLRGCTHQSVRALDFSDDRLGDVLGALNQDPLWEAFEGALTRRLLRVYDLSADRVRLDSTSASGYWEVTSEGKFQFGHSKDHRPDLPQVKVMLSTLDPLGLPVATDVVSGKCADDPLYIPSVIRVRKSLGRRGLLYLGDCKMAALKTRAFVHSGGDFSLCPLSETHLSAQLLETYLIPVRVGEQAVTPIYREQEDGQQELIAEGYERMERGVAEGEGETMAWMERRLVIRSLKQAQAAEKALRARLEKAQQAIASLNEPRRGKRCFRQGAPLRQAAEAILERYRVQGLLSLSVQEDVHTRPVRRYRERPARVEEKREVRVSVGVNEEALEKAVQKLGWRVYATNQPQDQLSLRQVVLAYRSQYLIERSFGRLKGHPLSLSPMYLQRDDHATGLIRLLSIGLRVLTLLEFVARRRLDQEGGTLLGYTRGISPEPHPDPLQNVSSKLLRRSRSRSCTKLNIPIGISLRSQSSNGGPRCMGF